MTRAFLRLCGMELRLFLARPLTWLVLGGLFAAMLIGAETGAERRSAQERTIERLLAQEDRSRQVTRDAAKRYAAPSVLTIENHRDPTDAFGYMNYFLVSHGYKIPAPLAALAVGQSDLRPYYERVDFTSVLSDGAYEPENPRTLAAGSFDLAFVLIYLVPLAVIALTGTRLSGELDSGVLRLIASHPMPPRQVAIAKFGGPALAVAALIVASTLASLVTTGEMHVDAAALPAVALVAFAIAGYTLLWCAAAAAVATLWQGAARSVVILVGAWLLTSLVVPFAAAMVISMVAPPPSRAAYIDASREAMDAFFANESAIYASYVAARPHLREASPSLVSNSALKRFARDEAYKAPLSRWEERFDGHARRVDELASWLRLLSPALALDGVLQRAAGTDAEAYRRFAQRSREHAKELRQFFEPLALANAVKGEKRSCDACPGRMNFTAYDRVPTFVPDSSAAAPSFSALANALLSWIAAAALALVAARRLAEWPA
jgi:ABC-2 type transport system permease protein